MTLRTLPLRVKLFSRHLHVFLCLAATLLCSYVSLGVRCTPSAPTLQFTGHDLLMRVNSLGGEFEQDLGMLIRREKDIFGLYAVAIADQPALESCVYVLCSYKYELHLELVVRGFLRW